MHPRHRLDLSLADVGHGLVACVTTWSSTGPSAAASERASLASAGLEGRGLVTLSVRSAWDLLLGVLRWPAGSEVLVSAVTHPEMAARLVAHGLVAVPVDLDPVTLLPDPAVLEGAVTARTRGVLVAQLFGARADLGPVADVCRRHGLLLVEDAAQAYAGPGSLGRTAADVSLTSFGLIKTATAVGGAVVAVRDPGLLADLRAAHRNWPAQPRAAYAGRLLRAGVMVLLTRPGPYGVVWWLCSRLGVDPDAVVTAATRSYAPQPGGSPDGGAARLRQRPSAALVALLARRLRDEGTDRLRRRTDEGDAFVRALPAALRPPWSGVANRTHWLLPVLVEDPAGLVAVLRGAGFDASAATSNLVALGRDAAPAPAAAATMQRIVYLPVYPELDDAARARLHGHLEAYAAGERPVGCRTVSLRSPQPGAGPDRREEWTAP